MERKMKIRVKTALLISGFLLSFFVGYFLMSIWEWHQREEIAGEHLMRQHELKHQAILNDHKR
jgi:hypothetical protein